MKRTTFLLFFICLFFVGESFAQNPDLPLFEEEKVVKPCPTCTKSKVKPNIGNNAEPTDSVYLAPPPFPPVNVTMTSGEELPARPFEGVEMKYDNSYKASAYADRLSAPVDFAANEAANKPKIQIKEEKPKVEEKKEKTEEKKQEEVKKSSSFAPQPEQKKPASSVNMFSDASNFDVAELYLGMTPEEATESAVDAGFEVEHVAYDIPSFMVSSFEADCRNSGVYQLRMVNDCVRNRAQKEEVYFISQMTFKKPMTKEQVVVLFSSPLTDNKAFKIDYTGFGDNSLGTSYKDVLRKVNRRDVFWKFVRDKYGPPKGNEETYYWGNPNSVLMRAYLEGNALNGRIILEDVTQKGIDYRQAEDWNKEQEVVNPFTF